MSTEETIQDDPRIEDEPEPSEEAITIPTTETEIEECAKNHQLTGDEEVVASGSELLAERKPEENREEYEKRLFKAFFPEAYKRRYGEI